MYFLCCFGREDKQNTHSKKGGSKNLTISGKGVITVKKGTKKGNYKIKVAVTAAGNAQYDAGRKIVTVKVKVKVK